MKRRLIAGGAVALAVFGVFGAGLATQRYVLGDEKGPTAECIILERDLREFSYVGVPEDNVNPGARRILDDYNEQCR